MSDTVISLKNETLTYTGNHFHTTPSGAKEMLEKYGIAIIPDRLNSEECQQMNEGMWQTAEYLTSKLSKPLKRSDPTTVFQLESEMGGIGVGVMPNMFGMFDPTLKYQRYLKII